MGLVEEGLGADRKAKTNIAGTSVRAPFLIQSIPTTLSNRSTRQWRRYCEQSDVSFETHLRLMLPIVANCLCGSVSTEGLPPSLVTKAQSYGKKILMLINDEEWRHEMEEFFFIKLRTNADHHEVRIRAYNFQISKRWPVAEAVHLFV
ncbi:uncharacterized protein LOC126409922 isoform X1 [Nymphaea colorata]|nr:uncharacterized protein LOC126409922 isoform X1 [Nymphaea colorata]